MCGLDVHAQRSACGEGGGGHGVGWAGRPACWSAWCTCCAHCGAPAGGLQLTTPGGRGAEIPHVRGAERAALRLSLAGGRWRAVPRVRTTVVHRSPHHSLFTVRVQSTDVGTCMLGCCASSDELRECPLSALYTYRDTTIDVWTYGKIGISSGPATPGLVVLVVHLRTDARARRTHRHIERSAGPRPA